MRPPEAVDRGSDVPEVLGLGDVGERAVSKCKEEPSTIAGFRMTLSGGHTDSDLAAMAAVRPRGPSKEGDPLSCRARL